MTLTVEPTVHPDPSFGLSGNAPTGTTVNERRLLVVRTDDGDDNASTGLWKYENGAYVRVGASAKHASQHQVGGSDPVTLSQYSRSNGQAGMYLSPQGVPPNGVGPLTAGRIYAVRFTPSSMLALKHMAFGVGTAGSADTGVDVGILDASGNLLGSNGAAATNQLATTGVRTLSLSTTVTVQAGTVYYAAFQTATITGSPQVCYVNLGVGQGAELFGLTLGTAEVMYANATGTTIPSEVTFAGPINFGVALAGLTT